MRPYQNLHYVPLEIPATHIWILEHPIAFLHIIF